MLYYLALSPHSPCMPIGVAVFFDWHRLLTVYVALLCIDFCLGFVRVVTVGQVAFYCLEILLAVVAITLRRKQMFTWFTTSAVQ